MLSTCSLKIVQRIFDFWPLPLADFTCNLLLKLDAIQMISNAFFLCAIAADRLCILKGNVQARTPRRAWSLSSFIWAVSISIVVFLPIYGKISKNSVLHFGDIGDKICESHVGNELSVLLITIVMHLILPFAVLIYCYSQLILKVKKLASLQEAARSYETIVIRRTIILLSIYACSWAPFHCVQMFEVFFPCSKYHFHFLQSLQEISVFIGYAGSCINPFVYAVVTDDFRNDILTFLDESQGLEKFMCCLQMELDYEIL